MWGRADKKSSYELSIDKQLLLSILITVLSTKFVDYYCSNNKKVCLAPPKCAFSVCYLLFFMFSRICQFVHHDEILLLTPGEIRQVKLVEKYENINPSHRLFQI